MGRPRRDCPICNKKGLLRLPNHLRSIHNLDPQAVMASRAESLFDDTTSEYDDFTSDSSADDYDGNHHEPNADDLSTDSDDDDSDDNTSDDDDDDTDVTGDDGSDTEYEDVWSVYFVEHIFDYFKEDMNARVAELQEGDMSTSEAQDITFEDFLPQMTTYLKKRIMKFCRVSRALKKDHIFQKILATAKNGQQEDEMDWEESMLHALTRRRFLLKQVLCSWTPFGEHEDSD